MWLVRICLEKTYSSVNLPGLCLFCYVLKFVTNKWYLHNFATHNNPRAASGCAGSQVCDAFQTGELLLLVLLLGLCSSQRSASSLLPPNTLQPSAHCRLQLLMPTKCFCSEDQCHYSKMDDLLSPVICRRNVARSCCKYFGMTAEIHRVGLVFCCLGPGPRSHSTTIGENLS